MSQGSSMSRTLERLKWIKFRTAGITEVNFCLQPIAHLSPLGLKTFASHHDVLFPRRTQVCWITKHMGQERQRQKISVRSKRARKTRARQRIRQQKLISDAKRVGEGRKSKSKGQNVKSSCKVQPRSKSKGKAKSNNGKS